MAKEYIEREDALKAICSDCLTQTDKHHCCSLPCIEYKRVKSIPAADVRPVVRGRWIESYSGWTPTKKCSACDVHFTQFPMKTVVKGEPIKPVLNFCPNCGADMREDTNDTQNAD